MGRTDKRVKESILNTTGNEKCCAQKITLNGTLHRLR